VDPQMRGSISTEGLIAATGGSVVYGDAKTQ